MAEMTLEVQQIMLQLMIGEAMLMTANRLQMTGAPNQLKLQVPIKMEIPGEVNNHPNPKIQNQTTVRALITSKTLIAPGVVNQKLQITTIPLQLGVKKKKMHLLHRLGVLAKVMQMEAVEEMANGELQLPLMMIIKEEIMEVIEAEEVSEVAIEVVAEASEVETVVDSEVEEAEEEVAIITSTTMAKTKAAKQDQMIHLDSQEDKTEQKNQL
jgi:hypothetical protein